MFANKVAIVVIVLTAAAVGLAACAEILLALPLPRWIYVSIGMFALLGSGIVMAMRSNLQRWAVTFLLLSLLGVLLRTLYFGQWSTRKPFLHDLNRIEVGMSQVEVEQIMAGYIRGTGWWMPGCNGEETIQDSIVFRHSEDGSFNADWGIVTFRDGSVVNVEFAPD